MTAPIVYQHPGWDFVIDAIEIFKYLCMSQHGSPPADRMPCTKLACSRETLTYLCQVKCSGTLPRAHEHITTTESHVVRLSAQVSGL